MIKGIPIIYPLIAVLIFATVVFTIWFRSKRKHIEELPLADDIKKSEGKETVNESRIPGKGKFRTYYWTKKNGIVLRYLKEPVGSLWTADTTMPEPGACYLVKTKEGGLNDTDYEAYDPRHNTMVEDELPQRAFDATHVRKLVDNAYSTPLSNWDKFNAIWPYAASFLLFIIALVGLDKWTM